jgi:hypothetical protein
MRRRLTRIRLITMGSIFGAFAIASLIGGIASFPGNPGIGIWLDLLGASLVLTTAVCFVALILSERMTAPTLTPAQQAGVVTYLRVSRFVRGVVEAVLGGALIAAGVVVLLAEGATLGLWIIGVGIVIGLLAAGNLWLAHRLRSGARQPDPETAVDQV